MNDYTNNKWTTYTCTADELSEYDWITKEFMRFVRNVPLDSDAVGNIKLILEDYESRKSFWQKLKALFY